MKRRTHEIEQQELVRQYKLVKIRAKIRIATTKRKPAASDPNAKVEKSAP
jgi:hypothetical protein